MVLHLNKLESPSPKDGLCQVWLILTQWFWRRRFLNFIIVFLHLRNCLHVENGMALESPSPKDATCQVWLKLAQWFWRRFSNFINVFSLFLKWNYLPLEKGGTTGDQKSSLESSAQVSKKNNSSIINQGFHFF